jgi:hypothetical protein
MAEDEVGTCPGLGSMIVPIVGVEGNVRQTWKAVSSRLNHQVITRDVILWYQEKREFIFFTRIILSS